MKKITLSQWRKMNAKQRSWLVCRALGERATVFWQCHAADGSVVGGSYRSKEYCDGLIQSAKELTKERAAKSGIPFPHPLTVATVKRNNPKGAAMDLSDAAAVSIELHDSFGNIAKAAQDIKATLEK